jgi:uncharacterized protein (UPF0332 family)
VSLPDELLSHAWELITSISVNDSLENVKLRRSVSTAYYSLFHLITADAVKLLAPNVSDKTSHRIQRWFGHSEMKAICGRFLPDKLGGPLLELIGETASPDMQTVARNFIALQEARHKADYDLSYELTWEDCLPILTLANDASEAWRRLQHSAEINVFILSLLLWKNWDKDRA